MTSRESGMTDDGFALEEELNRLLLREAERSGQGWREGIQMEVLGERTFTSATAGGLERAPQQAMRSEESRPVPTPRAAAHPRRHAHRPTPPLGGRGYGPGTPTWASGASGSIFSLPEGHPPIARPQRVHTRAQTSNAVVRSRSASPIASPIRQPPQPASAPLPTLRREASFSLFPSPPSPRDAELAREVFRLNFEAVHGSAEAQGQYRAPFPALTAAEQPSAGPALQLGLDSGRRDRGCLAPLADWWRGLRR
ncbi:hypothetical protein BDZ91DRAFT_797085 [Kalaharituber pfeilii]|nr:hypothetical protein BDZ91DRAFT_797085 [Kalaharituber pfeilii]